MKNLLKWIWLSIIIFIFDFWTKHYMQQTLVLHQPEQIFSWFNLHLLYNHGAAFSFLSQAGEWKKWFFISVAFLVSVVILIWITRLASNKYHLFIALNFILGGAMGNTIDRMINGYVVDFIEIYISILPFNIFNPWPAFNIADSAIFIGTFILIIDSIFFDKDDIKI